MQYKNIAEGRFLHRPNRFIAQVRLGEAVVTAHVKNTGRCRELLLPDAVVYLEYNPHAGRKTDYSLIAVQKGRRLINMDSQAPNKVVEEALRAGWLPRGITGPAEEISREVTYGASRLDFRLRCGGLPVLMEVKGVTFEENGVVLFPDAPTERGIRHLEELTKAAEDGCLACALFVVQMEDVKEFRPNEQTHPAFGDALRKADKAGVLIRVYDCRVTPDTIVLGKSLPADLSALTP